MAHRRLGLWLIGARGSVGSSVALGLAGLQRKLIETTGMVTALPFFANLNLVDFNSIVIGGHEIVGGSLANSATRVGGIRPAYAPTLIENCRSTLEDWDQEIMVGCHWTSESWASDWQLSQEHWQSFQHRHQLDHIVIVNLAPSEPEFDSIDGSFFAANGPNDPLSNIPASVWYAYAAIQAGCSYVNFTPSPGANHPALIELARKKQVVLAGQDGKTGETLLKSILAPMFTYRNLKVLSWTGHNLLGNNDGRVLNDPANRTAKLKNKDRIVADILGYQPQTLTSIDFVESLDDWKTAWDLVHFQGFLNVPMMLQFTWQGCDSALAAPLVLDLARLVHFAYERGEFGLTPHLGLFFKAPQDGVCADLAGQWRLLIDYARQCQ